MNMKLSAHAREILSKLGTSLKGLRQKKNLTLEDVHSEFKIHPREIKAIENGSLEDMPSALLYLRCLKSYSKYLDYKEKDIEEVLLSNNCLNDIFKEYIGSQSNSREESSKKTKNIKIKANPFSPGFRVSKNIKTINIKRDECLDVGNY